VIASILRSIHSLAFFQNLLSSILDSLIDTRGLYYKPGLESRTPVFIPLPWTSLHLNKNGTPRPVNDRVAQESTRSSEAWCQCAARCALNLLSTERDCSFRPDKRLTILTPRARALAELLTQISFEHFNLIVSSDVGTNCFN
jgi:hypothetical protein